jgi:UDP-GlcNAc:undecaprenyl-phosphate/decaprenyl-phosphate GlcNAc-1-phosphate transferase
MTVSSSATLTLIISLLASMLSMPAMRWLSYKTGLLATPRDDRWHRKPTPILGGPGMLIALTISLLIAVITQPGLNLLLARWSILLGTLIMFLVGLLDDARHLKPPVKLVVQLLAATIVIFFGHNTINFFRWPIANIMLTFFWLVGITNAINLLDNMDGLAGGVALIATGFLSVFFYRVGDMGLLILSLALAGSILGFLVFNFPPAKIFMGDSGSMFIGFLLAALAVARRTQASNIFAIIGVPTLVFLLPILDTILVTITRLLRGQSPALGGTDHTSHRLVAFGLSERQALFVLYGIALLSGMASIALEALNYDLSLVLIPILLIGLSLFAAYLARLKVISTPQNEQSTITRWIANLTYKRRLFEIIFDLLLIGVSYYVAYWLHYGFTMTAISMNLFLLTWPIALAVTYASLYSFGVYRGMWRYIGIIDLLRYVGATILSAVGTWAIAKLVYPTQPFTGEVFLLYSVFLLIGLAGSRSSFIILDRIYNRRFTGVEKVNVLLYGAEDAGEIALRWILRNPAIGYSVVGFLDDDVLKQGSSIHGVNVLGCVDNLEQYISEKNIGGIIATTESGLHTPQGEKLVKTCKQKGVWVRVLRLEFELAE